MALLVTFVLATADTFTATDVAETVTYRQDAECSWLGCMSVGPDLSRVTVLLPNLDATAENAEYVRECLESTILVNLTAPLHHLPTMVRRVQVAPVPAGRTPVL